MGVGWTGRTRLCLSGHGLGQAGCVLRVLERAVLHLTQDSMPRKLGLVEISQGLSTLAGLEPVPTKWFLGCVVTSLPPLKTPPPMVSPTGLSKFVP